LYSGTSFRIESPGAWRPAFEECLGDAEGALFAEEERGREVILMCAFSSCKLRGFDVCDAASLPRVLEARQRRVLGQARRSAVPQGGVRDVYLFNDGCWPGMGRWDDGKEEGVDLRAFAKVALFVKYGPVRARMQPTTHQPPTSHSQLSSRPLRSQ